MHKNSLTGQNHKDFTLNRFVCISALYLFLLFTGTSTLNAQNAKLSLHKENATFEEVFKEIEAKTGYKFVYSTSDIDKNERVSIQETDQSLNEVLRNLFRSKRNISFRISNKHIALFLAQMKKISGTVIDTQKEPVIGANVLIKGTATGTITDIDGKFSLEAAEGDILQVSFIGYSTQEVTINQKQVFNITLADDAEMIDEVVVTALGIKREQKALGYAVQEVKNDQLTVAKGSDVATSLTGKIAGLNIKNSTEFAASPTITLRGSTPLLVVDGIPHYNVNLSDIPADDIESISVLKGSTASALYGSRGGDGAIMVTTKKAQKDGLDISVNSNTMFHAGFLKLPEVQNSYSSGGSGKYAPGDYVWGDKLDIGRTASQYNPLTYEWEEMPLTSKGKDNFKNFLEQALVTNNNISISQKGEYGSVRASLNHIYNKGQYPNSRQQKLTFSVGGAMDYKKFHLKADIAYNKNIFSNNYGTGYGMGSYMYNLLIWTGAEYDLREYRNYWRAGKEQEEQNWMDDWWYDNPYFLANERTNQRHQDLTNGSLDMSLDVTDWLKLVMRVGGDAFRNQFTLKEPISTRGNRKGGFRLSNYSGYSTTDDIMLLANKKFGDFAVDGFLGGSIYFRENDYQSSSTSNGLNMPGFFSLNASVDPASTSSSVTKEQINSLYGKVGLSWKSAVFVEVTGRNDWASTLAKSERSYFYPSVSGSVVISELLPLPEILNFWKVRGSWTQTKFPTGVYDINSTYSVSRNYWGNMTAAFYPSTIRDVSLRPRASRSYEIGTELYFFKNRLKFDLAYYHKIMYDLQRYVDMSYASGFSNTLINYGEEQLSRGVEFTISGDVIKQKDFTWTSSFNWAADRYYYSKIDEQYSTQKPWVAPGKTWHWLEMYDWEKAPDGQLILYNGMPKESAYPTYAGTYNPKWIWGWSNTFSYKDFTLSFSFDGRVGGHMFDYMSSRLWHSGRHIDSDNDFRFDEVVNGNHKGYIAEGVKVVSGDVKYDSDGNILEDTRVFAPNDVAVSYETYMRSYNGSERKSNFLKSKTFFKLRELSLSYRLPKKYCTHLVKGAEIALVGQNLLIWTKDFKFSDPDVDTENINSPSIRYVGANLKFNF
ncbi:SusC/RagA family TonB-linked outer membrane protein [Parabacteroides sp.]